MLPIVVVSLFFLILEMSHCVCVTVCVRSCTPESVLRCRSVVTQHDLYIFLFKEHTIEHVHIFFRRLD